MNAPTQKPRFAEDYVTVNERLAAFMEKYPEGSLQSEILGHSADRVTVRATAYRTPDDTRPGIGHSSLGIPGATPYTRGSELENCETSAWGRALAALGFEVKRGIATLNEIESKRVEAPPPAPRPTPAPVPNQSATPASTDAPSTHADGATVPELFIETLLATGKEIGRSAQAIVTTWLKTKGYANWSDFTAHGAADAPDLMGVLERNAKKVSA